MTIDESYKDFLGKLNTSYEQREATTIADWIFEDIANTPRLQRVTNKLAEIKPGIQQSIDKALKLLLDHTPVQYVLGHAWFYKMRLKVNPNVLIPRPETEELVSWILEDLGNNYSNRSSNESPGVNSTPPGLHRVLDVGTGSGCIALALKKHLPWSSIMAIDVSAEALITAGENAKDQLLEIDFKKIDFLQDEAGSLPGFNIIVSNPPYISSAEKNNLARNVVDHEPHLALFADKQDPLIFYKKIADFAETHLNNNGKIYVEIHEDYGAMICRIFEDRKFKCTLRKDLYGRDRMIKSER